MKSISQIFDDCKPLLDSVTNFIDKHVGSKLLRKCQIHKIADAVSEKGVEAISDNKVSRIYASSLDEPPATQKLVSAKTLLTDKLMLCYSSTSAYEMFKTDSFYGDYSKDTFYRFDTMEGANWERLQLGAAKSLIGEVESTTTDTHTNVLIFDDSLYARTGGKSTELCAKVFDHNDHKLRLGFRMMTGGWSNNDIFIPFRQSLLTTRKGSLMVGPDECVDGRTVRGKRRKLAKTKGTEVVCSMVKEAMDMGIPFDYVLFDTWFSKPSQLIQLKGMGAEVIAMVAKTDTKYGVLDSKAGEVKRLTLKEIHKNNKKRRGRSRYLLSVEATAADKSGNSIPVRLVFARNRNNRKDWVCFVCTDLEAGEDEVLRIYGMRWNIETYFKVSKSHLKLRTECHSPNYDAVTSHMVIVALRYMILARERYRETDDRTIEELFAGMKREIQNDITDKAIELIIDTLLQSVKEFFSASDAQMDKLVTLFVSKLPGHWRSRFMVETAA